MKNQKKYILFLIINKESIMKAYHILLVLCILSLTSSKVIFNNLAHKFIPSTEKEYLNYIQLMLGKHQQSTILSSNLIQVLKQHRPSVLNTPEQFIVYIVSSQLSPKEAAIEENSASNAVSINEELLAKELKSIAQDIVIRIIKNGDKKYIQEISKIAQEGKKIVNVLQVNRDQLTHFQTLLPVRSTARRLQQVAPTTDSTYLIKFFFSLLFVIVIISIVGFISDGSSKKDTLLYAKFIADVGSR